MSSLNSSMPNSYHLSKKDLKNDYSFMMCAICTSYPVFHSADSYAEHVRTHHSCTSKSITDQEVDLYSSYGEKAVSEKTTKPFEHSASESTGFMEDTDLPYTGISDYSDSFSYQTSELKKGLKRTGELLASVRRKQQLYGRIARTDNDAGKELNTDSNYKDRQAPIDRVTALITDMKSVQTDISKLQEDTSSQKTNLSKLQEESSSHKINIDSLRKEISSKTSLLSIHDVHIKELQLQVQQMNETMSKAQTIMTDIQPAKSAICDDTEDFFTDKSLDMITDTNNQVLDEKSQEREDLKKLKELLSLKVNQVKKLENEKELLSKDCDLFYKNMITKYENLKKDYRNLQNEHKNADQNQTDNNELIEELKLSLFQELEHSKSIQDQQIKSCKELEKLQNLLLEREQEIAQMNEASDSKNSEISDLKNRLKKGNCVDTSKLDLEVKTKGLVDIQSRYKDQSSELTNLKKQLNDLDSVKSELETTTKEFEDLKTRYDSQNSYIDDLKTKLQEDASRSLARIKDLKEQLDQKYDLISDLSKECKFKDTKINEFNDLLKRNIDSYTKDRSEMKRELNESSEKMKKLKQTIKDLEKDNNDLEEEKTSLKVELTSNRIEIQQVEVYLEKIKLLKKEKAELEKRCFELRNQHSDEKSNWLSLSTNQKDHDDLQKKYDDLKKELDEKSSISNDDFVRLNDEKSKLEDNISENEKVINDLRHEIKSLHSVLSEKEQLRSEIEKKSQTSFEEKLNEKDCVIVDMTHELKNMTNDIELYKERIHDLTTELCHTSKQSSDYEKKNNTLESDLLLKGKELEDLKTAQHDQCNKESEILIQLQNDLASKNDEIKELKRLLNEHQKSSHDQAICDEISKNECHTNTVSNTDVFTPDEVKIQLEDQFRKISDGKTDATIESKDKNEVVANKDEDKFEIAKDQLDHEFAFSDKRDSYTQEELHKITKDNPNTDEVSVDKDLNGTTSNNMDEYDSDTSFEGSSSSSEESDSELEVDDNKKQKDETVVDSDEDDMFVPRSNSIHSIPEVEIKEHTLSTQKDNLGSDFSDFDSDEADYQPTIPSKNSEKDLNSSTNGQQCETEENLTKLATKKADNFEKPKSVLKRQNANKSSSSCEFSDFDDEIDLPMSDRGNTQMVQSNTSKESENLSKNDIPFQNMKSDNSDFDSDSDDEFYEASSKAVGKNIHSMNNNLGSKDDDFSDVDSDSDSDDECTSISQTANTKAPQKVVPDKQRTPESNHARLDTESMAMGKTSLGSLPTVESKKSSELRPLSPKKRSPSLTRDLPPLSLKRSASSLVGDLPPLSPKPSTTNRICEDGKTNRPSFKTSKPFFLTSGGHNESDNESDFDDEEIIPKSSSARPNTFNDKDTASKNGTVNENNNDAKNNFGDLPPLRGKQSSLPPLSPKNSSASLLSDLPPLSHKTSSSASLLGDLPTLSPKPSTSNQMCKEGQTDSSLFKKTSSTFSFKVDGGDESDDADECAEEECIEEELSDFDDDDIALILENL